VKGFLFLPAISLAGAAHGQSVKDPAIAVGATYDFNDYDLTVAGTLGRELPQTPLARKLSVARFLAFVPAASISIRASKSTRA
jgi:hypothetical protein